MSSSKKDEDRERTKCWFLVVGVFLFTQFVLRCDPFQFLMTVLLIAQTMCSVSLSFPQMQGGEISKPKGRPEGLRFLADTLQSFSTKEKRKRKRKRKKKKKKDQSLKKECRKERNLYDGNRYPGNRNENSNRKEKHIGGDDEESISGETFSGAVLAKDLLQ